MDADLKHATEGKRERGRRGLVPRLLPLAFISLVTCNNTCRNMCTSVHPKLVTCCTSPDIRWMSYGNDTFLHFIPRPHSQSSFPILIPRSYPQASFPILIPNPHSQVLSPGLIPNPHSQSSFPGLIPRPHSQSSFPILIPNPHSQASTVFFTCSRKFSNFVLNRGLHANFILQATNAVGVWERANTL